MKHPRKKIRTKTIHDKGNTGTVKKKSFWVKVGTTSEMDGE